MDVALALAIAVALALVLADVTARGGSGPCLCKTGLTTAASYKCRAVKL